MKKSYLKLPEPKRDSICLCFDNQNHKGSKFTMKGKQQILMFKKLLQANVGILTKDYKMYTRD